MKYKFLPALFCFYFSFAVAQPKNLSEEDKIHQVITEYFEGFSELNISKVKSNCTNDFKLLEDGSVWNIDTLAVKFVKTKAGARDLKRITKLDFLGTKIHRNMAWTYYNNQAIFQQSGKEMKIQWLESAILNKDGDSWKILMLHSTFVQNDR